MNLFSLKKGKGKTKFIKADVRLNRIACISRISRQCSHFNNLSLCITSLPVTMVAVPTEIITIKEIFRDGIAGFISCFVVLPLVFQHLNSIFYREDTYNDKNL